jgi:lipoprotein-anchoring transpeptidase ErfK/SrfK
MLEVATRPRLCRTGFSPAVKKFLLLGPAALVLALAGCQTFQKKAPPDVPTAIPQADVERVSAALAAAPNSLAVFSNATATQPLDPARSGLVVDLDRQRAYVYSQGELVAATRIASGKRQYRTPTGDYRIGQKNSDHASNLYGKLVHAETGEEQPGEVDTRTAEIPEGMVFCGAPMRNFMRLHTLDGKATAVGFHQGHVPNRPASHGCIRLPGSPARDLFKMVPKGTPVFVYGATHGLPPRPLPEIQAPEPRGTRKRPTNP